MSLLHATIDDLWRRVERVLETHAPKTAEMLAAPASDRELADLENAIGLTLPADFRASLKIHNGQINSVRSFFCGQGELLVSSQIADRWQMLTEIDGGNYAAHEPGEFLWWKTTCIPFIDRDGDMLCIDMDPALEDRMGEIAYFDRYGEIEQGYGASFKSWLSSLADRLEAGSFRIDEYGYLWLDIEA